MVMGFANSNGSGKLRWVLEKLKTSSYLSRTRGDPCVPKEQGCLSTMDSKILFSLLVPSVHLFTGVGCVLGGEDGSQGIENVLKKKWDKERNKPVYPPSKLLVG